ncbi:winged helix-turn-helix domain-containing protein [Microbacteriaceae bacterium 4G12]
MALERSDYSPEHKEVVEHFYSQVVDGITLLSLLVNGNLEEVLADPSPFMKELSHDSQDFVALWKDTVPIDVSMFLNFLLPCPYFYDLELFIEKVSKLRDDEFLYYLFGEEVSISQIHELLEDSAIIHKFEEHILWESEHQRCAVAQFISNVKTLRVRMLQALSEVASSDVFLQELRNRESLVKQVLLAVSSHRMEPLALAQYMMGKPFKRSGLYEAFYFIPSHFLSHHRMRIFNSKVCIIMYRVTSPISDIRKRSENYELQLKALSDRNRLLILRLLSTEKGYGARIAEYLGITTATVSHHLEILKKAGFVQEEKIGTTKYFSYKEDRVHSVFKDIQHFISYGKD